MEMDLTFSPMEINLLDSINMEIQMALANINGKMEIHTLENLRMD